MNICFLSVRAPALSLFWERAWNEKKAENSSFNACFILCHPPRSSLVIAFPGGTGGGVHDINTYFD